MANRAGAVMARKESREKFRVATRVQKVSSIPSMVPPSLPLLPSSYALSPPAVPPFPISPSLPPSRVRWG